MKTTKRATLNTKTRKETKYKKIYRIKDETNLQYPKLDDIHELVG